jgi:predicted 3-demethylubiquinone-9 3-methyltransferase (glyoxalase superfamily)
MTQSTPKATICLWFDRDAEAAARFYAATFPNSAVGAMHRAPADFPGGKEGDPLVVEFTVLGIPCIGLNGGPVPFQHNESFSLQVGTVDQAETDRYWNAIVGNGGRESACGWCKDRLGHLLADHASRADTGVGGPGSGDAQARVSGDDDHGQNRYRRHRRRAQRRRHQRIANLAAAWRVRPNRLVIRV